MQLRAFSTSLHPPTVTSASLPSSAQHCVYQESWVCSFRALSNKGQNIYRYEILLTQALLCPYVAFKTTKLNP